MVTATRRRRGIEIPHHTGSASLFSAQENVLSSSGMKQTCNDAEVPVLKRSFLLYSGLQRGAGQPWRGKVQR